MAENEILKDSDSQETNNPFGYNLLSLKEENDNFELVIRGRKPKTINAFEILKSIQDKPDLFSLIFNF